MAREGVTPYKISTITAVGDLGASVDLAALFERVRVRALKGIDDDKGIPGEADRVIRVEYDGNVRGEAAIPGRRRRAGPRQEEDAQQCFGNQATLVVQALLDEGAGAGGGGGGGGEKGTDGAKKGERVNIKVFRNGRVQLTGIKRIERGREVVAHVAELLRECGRPMPPVDDRGYGYRVCLINSDFDVGFRIRRDALHRVVRERFPGLSCCYEPCIYPGVRIRYFWNSRGRDRRDADAAAAEADGYGRGEGEGVCSCESCGEGGACDGKGDGSATGACRKVTLSVFQSGKAIVVGAHTIRQLEDAYGFLVDRVLLPFRAAIELNLSQCGRGPS